MTYELEWREDAGAPGRWRSFADADELRAFVAETGSTSPALHGELRVRYRDNNAGWEVVTTRAAVARWTPPGPPVPLLTSRWAVEDAAAASQLRHVERLRACLLAAREDGLLGPRQVDELVSIFDQAVAGAGPAGRRLDPLEDRQHDIAEGPTRDR